jgi:hypothetical protein
VTLRGEAPLSTSAAQGAQGSSSLLSHRFWRKSWRPLFRTIL